MIVDVEYKEPQVDGTTSIPEHIEVKSWFFQKGDYSEAQSNYDNLWDAQPDMLIYALTKVYAGAKESDPNGDMELNYLITTNCKNAPYSSIEEAQQAATAAGYIVSRNTKIFEMSSYGYCFGSGYLSTMGNSIAFQELGSGDITKTETSGNSAGAAMDGYGGDFDSGNRNHHHSKRSNYWW